MIGVSLLLLPLALLNLANATNARNITASTPVFEAGETIGSRADETGGSGIAVRPECRAQ